MRRVISVCLAADSAFELAGLLMCDRLSGLGLYGIIGAGGWLGLNALGLTGPPNSLTAMVPIIVIGLAVDYAIQIVSHYREQRAATAPASGWGSSVRTIRNVPSLSCWPQFTTIVSLLASLFSMGSELLATSASYHAGLGRWP